MVLTPINIRNLNMVFRLINSPIFAAPEGRWTEETRLVAGVEIQKQLWRDVIIRRVEIECAECVQRRHLDGFTAAYYHFVVHCAS